MSFADMSPEEFKEFRRRVRESAGDEIDADRRAMVKGIVDEVRHELKEAREQLVAKDERFLDQLLKWFPILTSLACLIYMFGVQGQRIIELEAKYGAVVAQGRDISEMKAEVKGILTALTFLTAGAGNKREES